MSCAVTSRANDCSRASRDAERSHRCSDSASHSTHRSVSRVVNAFSANDRIYSQCTGPNLQKNLKTCPEIGLVMWLGGVAVRALDSQSRSCR